MLKSYFMSALPQTDQLNGLPPLEAGEDGRIAFERIVSIERAPPEQVYGIIVGDRTRRGKKLQKADK